MNASYRLNLSWFAVLVAAQTLVMGTFLTPLPAIAAAPAFCSIETGFVLNYVANSFAAPAEYDSGYAAFVLANQSSIDSGFAAKEYVLANSFATHESDTGYAAQALVLAKQAALVSTTALEAYRSSFSPDAGFMILYNPLAAQAGAVCYTSTSK